MLEQLKAELEQLAATGRLREIHPLLSRHDGVVEFRGRKLVDFAGWDQLSIANHVRLRRALVSALDRGGLSSASPRLHSGTTAEHISTEQRISSFLGSQSALLFSSKNQAVLSLVTALCGEADLIICDEQIQSPIVDAAYLVGAQVLHADLSKDAVLESEVGRSRPARRKIIFVESISPLTGIITNLSAVVKTAKRLDAQVVVDESYAWGVWGLRGAGGVEVSGVPPQELLAVYGSLAHGLASYGAVVAGSGTLAGYLLQRSRTFITEVPLPPVFVGLIEEAINLAELASASRQRIALLAQRIRTALSKTLALDVVEGSGPFVALRFPNVSLADSFASLLIQHGFLVDSFAVRGPFAELGGVRIAPSAAHSDQQIGAFLSQIAELAKKTV